MGLEEEKRKLLSSLVDMAAYKKAAQEKLRVLLLKDTNNANYINTRV